MGRVALVTGGSRGIGAEIALQFSALGYDVAIIYNNNSEAAENVVLKMRENIDNAFAFKCDVSNAFDVKALISQINSKLGKINVLVNNAGIALDGLFTDTKEEEWDRVFNVNVKGVFNCTKAVLPDMINDKAGKIINISSMWGQVGASCEVAYSSSKAAVIGMTKALAKEVAPSGINVNCVCPGVIKTDMLGCYTDDDISALKNQTPLGQLGTPVDIANMVSFLASDKAEFITGQIFGVNGGYVI